jgi:pimeloyl-ACP methyl ester carboxylesterase
MRKLRPVVVLAAGWIASAVVLPGSPAEAMPIGFRVLSARVNKPSGADERPLQIAVWYPATKSGGSGMSYRDYVALTASENHPEGKPRSDEVKKAVEEFRSFLASARVTAVDTERILATPMEAVRDAAPAKGTFPLVMISLGNGQSAHDQAFLGESLARHGFVAATVPSASRISGPMRSEEDIAAKAEEQAGDLARAASRVKTRAELEREGFAVVGHSFGARAALLLAMSDSSIRALVSLDGGIGAKTGRGRLEQSSLFHAKSMAAPILHFFEDLDDFMAPDFGLLDSLEGSRRFLVRVPDVHHVHFTSVGPLSSRAPSLAAATRAADGTGRSIEAVESSTLAFLDIFLNGTDRSGAPWKPSDPEFLTVEIPRGELRARWIEGLRGRLRVDDGGDSGLPVLFVHGNGGNRTQWAAQLDHLRRTRRAVAFDLSGMGESGPALDRDYSVVGFAKDVAAVADALELGRFVLVGHSYGGAVVAAYAGKHPDRLAGLVFADVAGDLRGTPPEQVERLRRNLEPGTYEEFTRRWFEGILAKGSEPTKSAVMKSLRATPREVFVAATTGLYSFDTAGALAPYRGPRFHIASFLAGNPLAIEREFPGMPSRTIPNASHWLMMDRPSEFNRILDEFLATLR